MGSTGSRSFDTRLAPKLARALLDFDFWTLNLEQALLPTASSNLRAHRLLESLGVRPEARPFNSKNVDFSLIQICWIHGRTAIN